MTQDRIITERKGSWQRMEELLAILGRTSLRNLHREEVREIGHIYRRTASDLAIARAESRDPRLVNYLNSLVVRAHGLIYRAESRGWERIRDFYAREFPAAFRRRWRFTALAFAVFMVFGVIAFAGTTLDPDFSELAGVSEGMRMTVSSRERWWTGLTDKSQIGSSVIMANNIYVMFYAFALGATLGLGTLYVMALNGASIAAVLALVYREGYGNELVTFMVGHGVIELSCIFIAGGAGLLIGSAIILPGDLSRVDALKSRGREAIQLIGGCVPLLVVAGIIEGFISPAPINPLFKYGIGAITGLALLSYLVLAGRE